MLFNFDGTGGELAADEDPLLSIRLRLRSPSIVSSLLAPLLSGVPERPGGGERTRSIAPRVEKVGERVGGPPEPLFRRDSRRPLDTLLVGGGATGRPLPAANPINAAAAPP